MSSACRVVFASLVACMVVVPLTSAFGQGPRVMQVPKPPDLVVQEVMITGFTQGDIQQVHLKVRVKNIGTGDAPACTVALCYSSNIMANRAFLVKTAQITSGIKSGASALADISFYGVTKAGLPWAGMLIAVVDPPVQNNLAGAIYEHGPIALVSGKQQDWNNVFGFIFTTGTAVSAPTSWVNPAVK